MTGLSVTPVVTRLSDILAIMAWPCHPETLTPADLWPPDRPVDPVVMYHHCCPRWQPTNNIGHSICVIEANKKYEITGFIFDTLYKAQVWNSFNEYWTRGVWCWDLRGVDWGLYKNLMICFTKEKCLYLSIWPATWLDEQNFSQPFVHRCINLITNFMKSKQKGTKDCEEIITFYGLEVSGSLVPDVA